MFQIKVLATLKKARFLTYFIPNLHGKINHYLPANIYGILRSMCGQNLQKNPANALFIGIRGILLLLEGNLIYPLRGNLPYRVPLKRQSNKMQILFPSLPFHSQLLQDFTNKNRPQGIASSRSVAISFMLKLFAP